MAYIEAKGLSFEYPNTTFKALNNVNLKINKGEFILLMGKTGSGKSTLLKLFVPAISPYGKADGELVINSSNVGYVPQNPDLTFVSETVRGELAFPLENRGLDNTSITLKIGELSSFFNLNTLLDKRISSLSGGERVAVAIASAMANTVDAIILDEPTAQLDSKASYELLNLLKRVNDELGVTVIMSSHLSDTVISYADRLVVLENGSVIFDNEPKNVNDKVLPFYPLSSQLFDERPLTVKQAIPLASSLNEKKAIKQTTNNEIIKLKAVSFAYDKKSKDVLDRLDFTAYEGKIHAIIGANGSGKTTLLKIIAGIYKPYSGKVKSKCKLAYLPQNPQFLFTKDTVGEEIDEKTATLFGLSEHLSHHPYDLSGGQMERLALAILSKNDFDVLLLDEPTKALDVFYKKELLAYLKSLNKTVIIVTHDLDFVGDVADYVSFLCDGIITLNGDRRDVLSNLDFYTTQLRRITRHCLNNAVSLEDLE